MRTNAILLAAALLAVPLAGNTAPPTAAGALGSDNVDYVASIPDVAAIGSKIIGDVMYVTTVGGVRTYDISQGIPVPLGVLELPHWENESVDTNGSLLIVSADMVAGCCGAPVNILYTVDVSNPRVLLLKGVVRLARSAHTATCIKDCLYAWTSGREVIDLANPSAPVSLGQMGYGYHHTDVDEAGIAWVDGSNALDTNTYGPSNLNSPNRYAYTVDGSYGWHGSLRPNASRATPESIADPAIEPGELILGGDEVWMPIDNNLCRDDGQFFTSHLRTDPQGNKIIKRLGSFRIGQGTLPNAKPLAGFACSSHWFDYHEGIVAIGWYEQGARFLDVSNPSSIRQIGYFMPAAAEIVATRFNLVTEGPLPGLYVYVFDMGTRGIDVLRFTGEAGGPTVLAPLNDVPSIKFGSPHPEFGWACRLEAASA